VGIFVETADFGIDDGRGGAGEGASLAVGL
jgi:hypothetical protein